MLNQRFVEALVGFFMLLGIIALLVLALQVSGLAASLMSREGYQISAAFDNIGDLKIRAPVTIGGVRIGQVRSITLNPNSFKADVTMSIEANQNQIPADSTASIFTAGLLGANYINITPGFDTEVLHNGSRLDQTHSAIVLENLIGQLMFKLNGDDKSKSTDKKTS